MDIVVVGTGAVGSVLGRRWAERGHRICYGSRNPNTERIRRLLSETGGRAVPISSAACEGDLVLLATPWNATQQILADLGPLTGKTLVDCVNPINDDFSGLEIGHDTSAAECIARWAPDSRVVKAFNCLSAATMSDPSYGGQPASMVYCGDDADAKRDVDGLAAELGFEPLDAGPLRAARYLEPLAMLVIQLADRQAWGDACAFRMVHR
jgi:NADPH-dependent F420 reductase